MAEVADAGAQEEAADEDDMAQFMTEGGAEGGDDDDDDGVDDFLSDKPKARGQQMMSLHGLREAVECPSRMLGQP